MGSFFKQIYRYTRPRRFRHNENLWPWVKITRAAEGHIKSLLIHGNTIPIADMSALKNSQSGDILLVASGPSVNQTDFSKLTEFPAMGVNGSWHLHHKVNFRFYVIIDMTFIDHRLDVVKKIISSSEIIFFTTVQGILKIVKNFGFDSLRCQICIIEDACEKIYQPKILCDEISQNYKNENVVKLSKINKNFAFSLDIRHGVFDAGTVVYWSLQILLFLGFSRIIIAGLDMNNFNTARFYENENDIVLSHLEKNFKSKIRPAFAHASNVLKNNDIEALNLSLESSLDETIFRKILTDEI